MLDLAGLFGWRLRAFGLRKSESVIDVYRLLVPCVVIIYTITTRDCKRNTMRVFSFPPRVPVYTVAGLIGLAAVAVVHVQADDEVISFTCEGTSCLECLNNGCGWFPSGGEPDIPGECVSTCSIIADAPCYAEEYFTGKSPQEICNIVTTDEMDWNLCSAVADCTQCTATAKSDGTSKCVWYEETKNCGSGQCNFLGCGSSTCPSDVAVPVAAPVVLQATKKPTTPVATPTVAQPPMAPVDMENPTLPPRVPVSSDIDNPTLEPVPTVEGETNVCERLSPSDCTTCISAGCGWVSGDACLRSCSDIADIACFDKATFPNVSNVSEICDLAEQSQNDASLCLIQTSCSDCLSVQLAVPDSKCSWFEAQDGFSFPSTCCIGCDVPGVLTTTCTSNDLDEVVDEVPGSPSRSPSPIGTSVPSQTQSPSLTQTPSLTSSPSVTQAPTVCEASTCDACLSSGCAYLGDQNCISSCSIIADTSCYDRSTFPNVTNITEICTKVEKIENDTAVCSEQSTCSGCLAASLSEPDQSCTWYAASGGTQKSRCCWSCGDVPGTPVTTCDGVANRLDSAAVASNHGMDRMSIMFFAAAITAYFC